MRPALTALALSGLFLLAAVDARAVTVRAEADDFDFASDDQLVVEFFVEDAASLTGLEFSIVYPSDLLAVDQPSTHVVGPSSPFSHGFVNHEADAAGLEPGLSRIGIAFATAEPVTWPGGLLLTVSFPLRCSDFSGGWPEGRPVAIDLRDAIAWTASGTGLPVEVTVVDVGVTPTVDCTSVPVPGAGFSTLKARHAGRGGAR
jgi:hypothetical protein